MEMFEEKTDLKCVAFEVEAENCCPEELASKSKSPVFNAMLFGKLRDKEQEVIPLETRRLESFLPFLRSLTTSSMWKEANESHVEVLMLAKEFLELC